MGTPLAQRPVVLVLDASVVLGACLASDGFRAYGSEELVAPPLLWSEVRSSLHEARWRGEIAADAALEVLARSERAPIRLRSHVRLGREAWRIADALGWAKTYDAEYVALAALLRCRLVTLDARLKRSAERVVHIVSPGDL